MVKLDPYINVDPGTMSPFQHGEVFVTADGTEADLDLGHYERFVRMTAGRNSNFTTGTYLTSASLPRSGAAIIWARRVQVIPHLTDEIKYRIRMGAGDADVCMVEIGGTVGDIESLPFLEAIRQMGVELGRNQVLYMHLTLVPIVGGSSEIKTKPTQHSVKELRGIGIQPDILLCRCAHSLPDEQRRKIALFTSVEERAVISGVDSDDIYKISDACCTKRAWTTSWSTSCAWTRRPPICPNGGQSSPPSRTPRPWSTSAWSASTCRFATRIFR